jgi:hypothetical protein
MTLLQINEQFKTVTDAVEGLNGYSFGWPSDRTRSQIYDEPGEDQTDLYPRVLFAVPTLDHDMTGRNDTYQCQVFFDDLLGYDDDGEANTDTQVIKWSTLLTYAERWVKEMQGYITTGKVQGTVNFTLDIFALQRRVITVIASFTFVTKATC